MLPKTANPVIQEWAKENSIQPMAIKEEFMTFAEFAPNIAEVKDPAVVEILKRRYMRERTKFMMQQDKQINLAKSIELRNIKSAALQAAEDVRLENIQRAKESKPPLPMPQEARQFSNTSKFIQDCENSNKNNDWNLLDD